jgi:hypothetical protein
MTDFKSSMAFAERQMFRRTVEKSRLDHSRVAVLKKLGYLWFQHRFVAKEIRPGAAYLAKACKLSERTVRRILAEFRGLGFIVATALAKGGCGVTRYVVNLQKIYEHFSGVQTRQGELAEIVPESMPEPEYADDGTPVFDPRDMPPCDLDGSADEIEQVPGKSGPTSPFVTMLRPAKLADGNIGQYRSSLIRDSMPVAGRALRLASRSLYRFFGLQAGVNSYLLAKEGLLCEL